MERQGIKRRITSTYWTEMTAGHRRRKDIPVCGSCHADGTRTPSMPRNWVDTADGRRKRGRPKKTGRSTFREDLQARGVSWSEKETMAADRVRWRNLLPIVPSTKEVSAP